MATEQDYKTITDKLNFIEKIPIKKNYENGLFIVRGEINRRDVLLKIIPNNDENRIHQLHNEIFVDKIFEKHNQNLSLPLIVKARVLGSGSNQKYTWLIRRYYPGSTLAKYVPGKPLFGYDIIRPKFILKKNKIISQIVDNLSSVSRLSKNLRNAGVEKKSFKRRFPTSLYQNKREEIENELSIDLSGHVQFLDKIKKDYFHNDNIKACVGDLTPANIIVREDGQLVFSDFELFCFDNYSVDIAYLWMFLWRCPGWQKALISETIKNDKDREFFRASIIRIMFLLYSWPFHSLGPKKKDFDSKTYNRKHIWTNYLIASEKSFEALMKIKK